MSRENRADRLKRMYREEKRNRKILLRLAESEYLSPEAEKLINITLQANQLAINALETKMLKCTLDDAGLVNIPDTKSSWEEKAPSQRKIRLPVKKINMRLHNKLRTT